MLPEHPLTPHVLVKRSKAAIIACMSKLLRIIFAVLKTGRPFDPDYETNRLMTRSSAPQAA
jgi:hypothetical protein